MTDNGNCICTLGHFTEEEMKAAENFIDRLWKLHLHFWAFQAEEMKASENFIDTFEKLEVPAST